MSRTLQEVFSNLVLSDGGERGGGCRLQAAGYRISNFEFRISKWLPSAALALTLALSGAAQAQVLIDHNFSSFNTGDLVGQQGWTQIGSAASPNLTVGSGVVNLSASGQDAGVAFTSANSGSIYLGY